MSKKEPANQSDAQATTVEYQSGVPSTARNPLLVKQLLDIDVTEHLEEKMGMSYLPWSIAVKQLILLHPTATWKFLPHTVFPDTSIMVKTSVSINDVTKEYILPVYGSRGKAITNPDAFQINTAYQRCLVKTIASFGLGLDVFTQDDTDDLYVDYSEATEQSKDKSKDTPKDQPKEDHKLHNYFSKADQERVDAQNEFKRQMIDLLKSCDTLELLQQLWIKNKPFLVDLKKENKNHYDELFQLCGSINKTLKEKE